MNFLKRFAPKRTITQKQFLEIGIIAAKYFKKMKFLTNKSISENEKLLSPRYMGIIKILAYNYNNNFDFLNNVLFKET